MTSLNEQVISKKALPRSSKRDKLRQSCYLCQAEANLTEEHILPRCLFRPERIELPPKLTTCNKCNAEKVVMRMKFSYIYCYLVKQRESEKPYQKYISDTQKITRPFLTIKVVRSTHTRTTRYGVYMSKLKPMDYVTKQGIHLGVGGQKQLSGDEGIQLGAFYQRMLRGLFTLSIGKTGIGYNDYPAGVIAINTDQTFDSNTDQSIDDLVRYIKANMQFYERWGEDATHSNIEFGGLNTTLVQNGKMVSPLVHINLQLSIRHCYLR